MILSDKELQVIKEVFEQNALEGPCQWNGVKAPEGNPKAWIEFDNARVQIFQDFAYILSA